jgi:hypothetical protein
MHSLVSGRVPRAGSLVQSDPEMNIQDARRYVSHILIREFRRKLTPAKYSRLASMLLRNARMMDGTACHWGGRRLAPFPAVADPPWEHQELLLRTWPELCQLYGSPHGMRDL